MGENEGKVKRASAGTRYSAYFSILDPAYIPWCHGMLFFKEGMDFQKFSETVEKRLFSIGRLNARYDFVKDKFLPLSELDKDYHLTEVTDMTSIEEISNEYMGNIIEAKKIDLDKPLWFAHFFPHIEDGRSLAIITISHVIGDGVSLVELVFHVMDPPEGKEEDKLMRANSKRKAKSPYGPLNKTKIFLGGIGQAFASVAAKPDSRTVLTREDVMKPALKKNIAFTEQISLDKVKEIKSKIKGATINDVLVAVLNMILVNYLNNSGHSIKELGKKKLRAGFPINLRRPGKAVLGKDGAPSNKFGVGVFKFFTKYEKRSDLVLRVKDRIDRIKLSPYPVVQQKLGGALNKLQSKKAIAELLLKFITQTTAQLSNVPGPQKSVSFGGVEIDDLQFGLYSVQSLYLGLISYNNKVSCCVCLDETLGDAKSLAKYWKTEFDALYEEVMEAEGIIEPPKTFASKLKKL